MNRLYIILLCGMLCAAGCTDDKPLAGNKVGELTWVIGSDGTLSISGKGAMLDYYVTPTEFLPPWFEFRDKISNIVIGNDVSNIGDDAFFRCSNIISVTIGNSVTTIGRDAFSGCSSLKSVVIPNSVTDIGYGAFYGCNDLASVTIGNSVANIGQAAFMECPGITEIINYQKTPQKINFSVFGGTSKTDCTLMVPDGTVDAYRNASGWNSFYKMGIIGVPGSVVTGGKEGALSWTLSDDKTLTISGTGKMPNYYDQMKSSYTPSWMVYQQSIIRVVVKDGVINIGSEAFKCYGGNCYSNISSVTIGSTVTAIGDNAFANCIGLKEIVNYQKIPQYIDENVFADVNKTECTLLVPAGSENAYRSKMGWKDFKTIKTINN